MSQTDPLFSQIEPRAVEYVWREHIPAGMLTAMGGLPGRGKSMLSTHIAAAVTRDGGRPVLQAAPSWGRLCWTPPLPPPMSPIQRRTNAMTQQAEDTETTTRQLITELYAALEESKDCQWQRDHDKRHDLYFRARKFLGIA